MNRQESLTIDIPYQIFKEELYKKIEESGFICADLLKVMTTHIHFKEKGVLFSQDIEVDEISDINPDVLDFFLEILREIAEFFGDEEKERILILDLFSFLSAKTTK